MKTQLSLMAVAVGLAFHGASQAQSSSTIEQYGSDNVGTVTQESNTPGGSYLLQNGANNEGIVTQSDNAGAQSYFYQYGNGNGGVVAGEAAINQHGNTGVYASVYQSQYGGEAGNRALVDQGASTGMNAYVGQYGSGNWANLQQSNAQGGGHYSSIGQSGNNNTAYAWQFGTTSSIGWMYQYGNGNYGWTDQVGTTNGYAYVQSYGDNNGGYVYQTGINNSGRVEQGSGYLCTNPPDCTAYNAYSNPGNLNYAYVQQYGSDDSGYVGQFGNFNTAYVFQDGSWSRLIVGQIGDSNFANVTQHGSGSDFASRAGGALYQWGSNESITLTQAGADLHVRSDQYDAAQEASITQTGTTITARVNQAGGGAWADRNITTITQAGNGHFSAVTQSGMRNVATVTQN